VSKSYLIKLGMNTMAKNDSNNWIKNMALGSMIATSLAGLVAGGYLLGNFLDSLWGTDPFLKIILMFLGVALGIAYLFFTLSKFGKSNDEQ